MWLNDPWAARNDYISIILDRSFEKIQSFLNHYALKQLDQQELTEVLRLLEVQRYLMLMYTSCGWFFDELSGLETVQIIQYAGRALQIAKEVFPDNLEEDFLTLLEQAKSNLPEHGDGRQIYEKFVKPAMVDLLKVGAHYAISSLFEEYSEHDSIFCYDIHRQDYHRTEAGRASLAIGRIQVTSRITYNSGVISFGVLHLGDHNIYGGVKYYQDQEPYDVMTREVTEVFAKADFPETIRNLDRHFGTSTYSLRSLFRDEQRQVLQQIMSSSLQEVGAAYQQIYKTHVPLMRFLTDLGAPLPKGYLATAELVINQNLRQAFAAEEPDMDLISGLLMESRLFQIEIEAETLEFVLRQTLERLAVAFSQESANLDRLKRLEAMVELANSLPFEVNLRSVQNICYDLLHRVYPEKTWQAQQGDEAGQTWVEHFVSLAGKLRLAVSST